MRIAPVGIATAPEPVSQLVDVVAESCRLTHKTAEAIGAAAAVAAIVSAGIDGAGFEASLPLALDAAREGETRARTAQAKSISAQIEKALELAADASGKAATVTIAQEIGTSVSAIESVPMAFAIARISSGDPWSAALMSTMVGDDTDTIGAISCGMLGASACLAKIEPETWRRLCDVNALDLGPIVSGLLAIRSGARAR